MRRGNIWYVVISWTEHGKKRQRWTSTRTSDEDRARAALRQAEEMLRAGLDLSDDPTVEDWLRKWYASGVALGNWRSSTAARYKQAIDLHLITEIGQRKLRDVKPSDIEALSARLASHLKANTVLATLGVLSAALRDAEHEGLVIRNAAGIARKPHHPRRRKSALAVDDAVRLMRIAYARPDVWGYYIELGILTGMRRGELLGLRWADVDLEHGVLRVVRQRQEDKATGGAAEWAPKSEAGKRGIALPKRAVELLRELWARYRTECRSLGIMSPQYVITHRDRRTGAWVPYYPSATKALRKIYALAGVETSQPSHALRYTQAALLEAVQAEGITRQHRLGHSSMAETEGYTPEDIEAQRRSAEQAARLLGDRKPPKPRSKEATKRARS